MSMIDAALAEREKLARETSLSLRGVNQAWHPPNESCEDANTRVIDVALEKWGAVCANEALEKAAQVIEKRAARDWRIDSIVYLESINHVRAIRTLKAEG